MIFQKRREVRWRQTAQIVSGILEQPSCNIRIVDHQQEVAGKYHAPCYRPEPAVAFNGKIAQRARHSLPRGSPQGKLCGKHRKAENRQKEEVHKHECRTSILANDERETPYVSESDGTSCRQHQKPKPRSKFCAHLNTILLDVMRLARARAPFREACTSGSSAMPSSGRCRGSAHTSES